MHAGAVQYEPHFVTLAAGTPVMAVHAAAMFDLGSVTLVMELKARRKPLCACKGKQALLHVASCPVIRSCMQTAGIRAAPYNGLTGLAAA